MSTENLIYRSDLKEDRYEQPDRSEQKSLIIEFVSLGAGILLGVLLIGTIDWCVLKFNAQYSQLLFSVVTLSVTGLKPHAIISSPPAFHVVLLTEKAFENSTHPCLESAEISVLYEGSPIATTSEDVGTQTDVRECYNAKESSEFVIAVPLPDTYYKFMDQGDQLWNEIEHAKFDLEMKFIADYLPSKLYHVVCNNLTLGTPDVPIACDATMKTRFF